MALLGTEDNPYKSSKDVPASLYFRGNKAVQKMEKLLDRELTPTEKKIVAKEGYVDGYYRDSIRSEKHPEGVLTRGVGQTGDYTKGKESHSGFEKAIADSTKAANKQAKAMSEKGRAIDPNFTESLVGVNFQLGSDWTTEFPTAWSNLQSGDYEDAIEEIKFTKKGSGVASNWAKQTPTRVNDFTQAIRNLANYKLDESGKQILSPAKEELDGAENENALLKSNFGKQSNSGNYEQIKNMVAGGTDNIIASRMPQEEIVTETQEVIEQRPAGFKQLEQQMFNPMQSNYANQNLPKAPQNLERVELPPDQKITPYRETIKEDVTVRPDQIRVNEDIQLSTIPNDAYQYPVDAQQERARRSMMHGNYDDRMEDYKYDREYQEDYPYLYPRNTGSYALPQQQAAQRMMGGGMGYAQGGTVNQAQNMASSNQQNQGLSLTPANQNQNQSLAPSTQTTQGLASLGRGGDSTLVHMQPQEVAGLQQLAQANGTSLTTNPMTGYPEAFNLRNMFKAALPIAAGYFTGGAATPFLGAGTATASAITAGALTGAGVAAVSGDDVLAGGLSGGLGGYSGMGLESAVANMPAATVSQAVPQTATSQVGMFSNPAGVSQAITPSTMAGIGNPALTTSGGMGVDPSSGFGNFDLKNNFADATMSQNVTPTSQGNFAERLFEGSKIASGTPAGDPTISQFIPSDGTSGGTIVTPGTPAVPGTPLQAAMRLGGPAVSMGMGGLEESDFYDDIDFSDPRDKYDPYSKLNLNKDTGISAALAKDTGVRLLAEGGNVAGDQEQGLNLNNPGNVAGNNAGIGGLNLNTGQTGVTPADLEAAKLKAPDMEFIMGRGMMPKGAVEAGPLANYSRNMLGGYTFKGKQYDTPGYEAGGYLEGSGDGMSDDIPAMIDGNQPAALSTGEYVVSADVVSSLGNGSSEAGAKRLHAMMNRVRKATTGRTAQAKEINPSKYMPA